MNFITYSVMSNLKQDDSIIHIYFNIFLIYFFSKLPKLPTCGYNSKMTIIVYLCINNIQMYFSYNNIDELYLK